MSAADQLVDALAGEGYGYFTGVPCSLLKNVFAILERGASGRYIPAVREDSAVGVAAGLQLAGQRCAVLMQNSGLGYCLNPLLSLSALYGLPLLLIVSWRGAHGNDAPEHEAIGERLTNILSAAGVPHRTLFEGSVPAVVRECSTLAVEAEGPAALLVSDVL